MKPIRHALLLTLCGLLLLWILALMAGTLPSGFFPWRAALVQGSGILAIGCMSVAMILAVRPVVLESRLNGLDKMYRLHKWLGISALVFSVLHWVFAKGPKWINSLGLFDLGPRVKRPVPVDIGVIEQYFNNFRHFAKDISEPALYLAVALIVLALVRRFPYRHFLKTHYLLAVIYLVLVVHSVILMTFSYWSLAVGVVMAVLMLAGSVSALVILFGGLGKKRRVNAQVAAVDRYSEIGFLSFEVLPETSWADHLAGQFAFLSFNGGKEAHPFTIASAVRSDRHLRFVIKGLGDATQHVFEHLKVDERVRLEGPYGQFVFDGKSRRQIWVAGGIGVTPFMARLEALASQSDAREIDFFYCAAVHDARFIEELSQRAAAAKVRLHVRHDVRDGFLDAAKVAVIVPQWQEADFWFCGPTGFGKALKNGLLSQGMHESRFHQELFEMR